MMRVINVVAWLVAYTIIMFCVLDKLEYRILDKRQVQALQIPSEPIEYCTADQAMKWWVNESDMTKVRKRLCGR
jgi:hypothetical protein